MVDNLNNLLLYFFLAVLPGTIWLSFFLQKDKLPEPKMKVLEIFFYGILATIPAVLAEKALLEGIGSLPVMDPAVALNLRYIIGVALPEEFFKYIIVAFFVLRRSCMDEPVDIPLYMIISALGFATAENILLFSDSTRTFGMILEPFGLSLVRFLGATLLHALCSGIIGYFIALSYHKLKQKWLFILSGFGIGIILHGLFDFYIEWTIMSASNNNNYYFYIFFPIIIIIFMFVFLTFGFRQLRKLKSICIIK
ncbi:MAG: PrsW family glutamic-type intramembrane protease [Candidatus Pacebacteria bacterium]|nr:PrsW family glutamic-type intramembrane protease [Candidatus Paceibacterota bacterium]